MRLLTLFLFALFVFGGVSSASSTSVRISVDVDGADHSVHHKRSHLKALQHHAESAVDAAVASHKAPLDLNAPPTMALANDHTTKLGPFVRAKDGGIVHLKPVHPSQDPFGPDLYMPSGPRKGQYMNLSKVRSIVILTPSQVSARGIQTHPGDVVFANFYHEGQFWIARVPEDAVEELIVQADIFDVVVGHAQCRYQLKEGKYISLYAQVEGQGHPLHGHVRDVITSNEAIYQIDPATYKEDSYQPQWGGITNQYLFGFRLVSAEQRQKEIGDGPSEQMRVTNIPDSLKSKVFARAIQLSNQAGFTQIYNTLTNSCSTTFYHDTLDYVLQHEATPEEKKDLKEPTDLWSELTDGFFKAHPVNPANIKNILNARGIKYQQVENFEKSKILY